jgi:hypothetical protein
VNRPVEGAVPLLVEGENPRVRSRGRAVSPLRDLPVLPTIPGELETGKSTGIVTTLVTRSTRKATTPGTTGKHTKTISAPVDGPDVTPGLADASPVSGGDSTSEKKRVENAKVQEIIDLIREHTTLKEFKPTKAEIGRVTQSHHSAKKIARVFVQIANGRLGGDFEKRSLSLTFAESRVSAFEADRNRRDGKSVPGILDPLTEAAAGAPARGAGVFARAARVTAEAEARARALQDRIADERRGGAPSAPFESGRPRLDS